MPIAIDDRYVDVDFPAEPAFTFGDVGNATFGAREVFEDSFATMTESQIREAVERMDAENSGMEWLVKWIKSQGAEGSCVGNMATQALQVLDAQEVGLDNVVSLSAMSVYRNIGSSPNSGAMISDALDFVSEYGALPEDTAANRATFGADVVTPATGWNTIGRYDHWSSVRKQVASRFRLMESYVVQSYWGLFTALCNGWPVGVGRQGHSIIYLRPVIRGGKLGVVYANSWGNWGFAAGSLASGFGFDSGSTVQQSASWAICFRAKVAR